MDTDDKDDNLSTLFETAFQTGTIDGDDPFGDNSVELMMQSLQSTLIKLIEPTSTTSKMNANVLSALEKLLEKITKKCKTKEDLMKLSTLCDNFSTALSKEDGFSFKTAVHKKCNDVINKCSGAAKQKATIAPSTTSNDVMTSRIASLDYQIENATLHNYNDLKRFFDRVNNLFNWFKEPNNSKYIAPYFPLIQSSGTGKTLLMHQMKKLVNKQFGNKDEELKEEAKKLTMEMENTHCFMFLANGSKTKVHLPLEKIPTDNNNNKFFDYMNEKMVVDEKIKRIILFFDEAQTLLYEEAMQFRWIQRWLRIRRDDKKEIVAVFSGTASSLSNYYPDVIESHDSRNPAEIYYNDDVKNPNRKDFAFYDPFYELTTVGSFALKSEAQKNRDAAASGKTDEYKVAAMYGRPLFAELSRKGDLDDNKRNNILQRMLLGKTGTEYLQHNDVVANILGTRIQMGHVSKKLSSHLVANGYAHLVGYIARDRQSDSRENSSVMRYDEDSSFICFLPDPVCAHLAMCIMDSDWKATGQDFAIHGKSFKNWTTQAIELFSSGICHPSKGDVGEAAASLYMLFCGDVIRKRQNENYFKFSVDLQQYMDCLQHHDSSPEKNSETACRISFIQIIRQYFRLPLKEMVGHKMLQQLYESSCALYLPLQSAVFDIVASICITNGEGKYFVPFCVSVKSRQTFSSTEINMEKERMTKAINDAYGSDSCKQNTKVVNDKQTNRKRKTIIDNNKLETKHQGALCILLLLDLERNADLSTPFSEGDVKDLCKGSVVCNVVHHQKDSFGICDLISKTRIGKDYMTEVYSSHWMLSSLPENAFNTNTGRYKGAPMKFAAGIAMVQSNETSIQKRPRSTPK